MPTFTHLATPLDGPRQFFQRFVRAIFIEGGRFWERGRLAYNGVQLLVTGIMLLVRRTEAHYFADNLGSYVAFALLANILYTTAYLAEAILQIPQLRRFTVPVRWCVLTAGTVVVGFLSVAALDLAVLTDPTDD